MSYGVDREWGWVCEGGTGGSHVPLLSTSETLSFLEALLPFLESELLGFLFGVHLYGIWVLTGSASSGSGGMESDWGVGGMLLCNSSHKVSLAEELVKFLIPLLGHGRDYFHAIDLV